MLETQLVLLHVQQASGETVAIKNVKIALLIVKNAIKRLLLVQNVNKDQGNISH